MKKKDKYEIYIETAVEAAEKRFSEKGKGHMKALLEEFQDRVKGVAEQFTSLNTKVDDIKETVGEMKVEITGLRLDVNELKDDMAGVKEDIGEIREDISGIRIEFKTKQPI